MAISDLLSEGHAESLLPYTTGQTVTSLPGFKGGDTEYTPLSKRSIKESGPNF